MSLQAADVTVGVDDHVARVEDSSSYFYYDDALQTVAGLTNPDGDRAAYYEYDAWGNEWSWNSGSLTNRFLYTGLFFDQESGLLYVRNRYLDPTSGRFLSRDPEKQWGQSAYPYSQDSPVGNLDRDGRKCASATHRGEPNEPGVGCHCYHCWHAMETDYTGKLKDALRTVEVISTVTRRRYQLDAEELDKVVAMLKCLIKFESQNDPLARGKDALGNSATEEAQGNPFLNYPLGLFQMIDDAFHDAHLVNKNVILAADKRCDEDNNIRAALSYSGFLCMRTREKARLFATLREAWQAARRMDFVSCVAEAIGYQGHKEELYIDLSRIPCVKKVGT